MNRTGNLLVREEQPRDRDAVRHVNEAAFGRPDEADLIESLRAERVVLLSLVAEVNRQIAGHMLFSRMRVETEQGSVPAVALAPMAVGPEHQRRGIGSQMVHRGLAELRDRGERICIVLGNPEFYERFGFSSEKARCLSSPFPPEVFMALELADGGLSGIRGAVRYPPAFDL